MSSTLFERDYSFRGEHAKKVNELTAEFGDGGYRLFGRNLDVYLLAPIVGFLYGKKAALDSSETTTNILLGAMVREKSALWFNYRLIVLLDEENEPDFEKRVEKAFRHYGTAVATTDEELYEAYVRGGIEILHEKLVGSTTSPEGFLQNLYEFMEEFEKKYGQSADEIIDLVQLAKG